MNIRFLQQKKVIFYYYDLNENGEEVYRNGHHHYVVEPIALIFNEDNYYLMVYSSRHNGTANYRVDRMDAVEIIRKVGAKLILVTRFGHSPAAEFADAVLISGADEGPLEFGSSDALLSQLYVVETLLACYQMRSADNTAERKFVAKNIAQKML